MKVLLCTPYVQNPNVITGGINIWGKNIVQYYAENPSDIDMIPVSFDRKVFIMSETRTIRITIRLRKILKRPKVLIVQTHLRTHLLTQRMKSPDLRIRRTAEKRMTARR